MEKEIVINLIIFASTLFFGWLFWKYKPPNEKKLNQILIDDDQGDLAVTYSSHVNQRGKWFATKVIIDEDEKSQRIHKLYTDLNNNPDQPTQPLDLETFRLLNFDKE